MPDEWRTNTRWNVPLRNIPQAAPFFLATASNPPVSMRCGKAPWEETAADADRTRTGRGPHDRIQNGCGPDADRTRAAPFLPG
eukprot:gene21066-biopygen17631